MVIINTAARKRAGCKHLLAAMFITIVFDLKSNGTKGLAETTLVSTCMLEYSCSYAEDVKNSSVLRASQGTQCFTVNARNYCKALGRNVSQDPEHGRQTGPGR